MNNQARLKVGNVRTLWIPNYILGAHKRGHRNEIFVLLNGFWPLRRGGGQHLDVNFYKVDTKIFLRKLRVAYVFRENTRQREVSFYIFCVYKRQTEYNNSTYVYYDKNPV